MVAFGNPAELWLKQIYGLTFGCWPPPGSKSRPVSR